MSYKELPAKKYQAMNREEQIIEFSKWIEDALENHKANIRAIAGTMPEMDEDIAEVIDAPFKDLATLINDYDEDSVAHAILKYRLENGIQKCDDSVLDADELGPVICRISLDCESEEDSTSLQDIRGYIDNFKIFCWIFNLEALMKSLNAWRP